MKIVDNILYIEFQDFFSAAWKEDTIKKANLRNGPTWKMISDPDDRRRVLVEYEALRKKDQVKLHAHFGNPYEYIAKQPILKLVEADPEAEAFYRAYRYDDNKYLPLDHILCYGKAAAWLNMIASLNADKRIIKRELNLTLEKFWMAVCELITSEQVGLPSSYRRLIAKLCDYKNNGYSTLIDWRFGNKLAAKLGKTEVGFETEIKERQIAIIRAAASRPNNFDAQQITSAVNVLFKKSGWPQISRETVYKIIKSQKHFTTPGRRGKREYNASIAMQRIRKRPAHPLMYITLDGWTAELLYRDGNTYNNRLTIVIVLDAMNNYPLGYAIGDRENTELIKEALRNAITHIHDLFGEWYQPRQLQSDNYGLKSLIPFYQAVAHLHTPAAVGNAKSKVIEPYFDYINTKYCQFMQNWSGHNITSLKKNQPNTEFLNMVKTNFPARDGVVKQLEYIIQMEREGKIEYYMKAWQSCADEQHLILDRTDRLIALGKPTGYTNAITGAGLIVTINGERIVYDSFNPEFRENLHLNWQVIYDNDRSSILVINEEQRKRFILDEKRRLPMDTLSMTDEDRAYHQRISNFNKERAQEIIETYARDNAIVNETLSATPLELSNHNEAALKLMFTVHGQQKEAIQDAKGLKKVQAHQQKNEQKEQQQQQNNWTQIQNEYLKSKVDFDEYSD